MGDGLIVRRGTFVPKLYIEATGGTIIEYNEGGKQYRSHTFTSNGNFVIDTIGNDDRNQVDYLIVAGGGSGGTSQAGGGATRSGGGGGAGGYLTTFGATSNDVSPNSTVTLLENLTYPIVIGAGGASVSGENPNGNNGTNSSAFDNTSIGGGGGSGSKFNGNNGGSGGGGGNDDASFVGGILRNPGLGTAGQGFNGGFPFINPNVFLNGGPRGGGGGGASQLGFNATADFSGNGGDGLANILRNGTSEIRGGGGGGRSNGLGGAGGGGTSGATSGVPNTGGGGRGEGNGSVSGSGGSGIVVIRYEISPSV